MQEDQSQNLVDMFVDNLADSTPVSSKISLMDSTSANLLSKANIEKPIKVEEVRGVERVSEISRENPTALARNKMSPKQRLVEDAMKLYPGKSRADLNKLKVTELKSLVDSHPSRRSEEHNKLITDTAKISSKPLNELEKMTQDQLKQEMGQTVNNNLQSIIQNQPVFIPERTDMRAQTLYNFHRVAAGVLECVSEADAIQQRTGSNLAGLSQQLKDNKEEFMEILKDLYREYHQDIDTYITPLTVYGVFMAEKLGAVFMENKKKISRGESVKSPLKLEKILGLDSQPSLSSTS